MPKYDKEQQDVIESLFKKLNEDNIRYVICRGHHELPKFVPGNDIDILVHENDYSNTYELAGKEDFQKVKKSQLQQVKSSVQIALDNPKLAVIKLVGEPLRVANFVLQRENYNSSSSVLGGEYEEFQIQKSNVHIHCFDHLVYRSPRKDAKVRVHPSIEQGMLQRRNKKSFFYIPSPADELAHLVCRGVFDKKGNFPEYYTRQCDRLYQEIQKSQHQEEVFMDLLSKIFFNLDEKVKELIVDGRYNDIKSELKASTNY